MSGPDNQDPSETVVREFVVRNKYGIHARPAALLVKTAAKFNCDITIEKEGMTIAGKSIMGLLTLEAHPDSVLTLTFIGPDAQPAAAALTELFENNFYED